MITGNHFWYSLINISETLARVNPVAQNADRNVLHLLQNLQQAYGRHITPRDQFECYSVMVLCSTLCKILEERMEGSDDVADTVSKS